MSVAVTLSRRAVSGALGALLLGALLWAAPPARAQAVDELERGRELFFESCVSCHGPEGQGTRYGPPIEDAGAAAADFQLRTGRMPLTNPGAQAERKPPAFTLGQIDALVAYVASLGEGPPIPKVDPAAGDLQLGRDIFIANCAPCHGANANGGAVGEDAIAPSLLASEPLDVAEAIITGPGQMPRFSYSDEQVDSVVRFVEYLQNKDDPGGANIGGVGPVPEGFVAWAVGGVALVLACLFIGHRRRPAAREPET